MFGPKLLLTGTTWQPSLDKETTLAHSLSWLCPVLEMLIGQSAAISLHPASAFVRQCCHQVQSRLLKSAFIGGIAPALAHYVPPHPVLLIVNCRQLFNLLCPSATNYLRMVCHRTIESSSSCNPSAILSLIENVDVRNHTEASS